MGEKLSLAAKVGKICILNFKILFYLFLRRSIFGGNLTPIGAGSIYQAVIHDNNVFSEKNVSLLSPGFFFYFTSTYYT
jgi:hypothetical protein